MLVWILVITFAGSAAGPARTAIVVDNIASYKDCDATAKAIGKNIITPTSYYNASCIQVRKVK